MDALSLRTVFRGALQVKYRNILALVFSVLSLSAWADERFIQVCMSPTLAGDTQHTITEMLLQAGTQSCEKADEYLSRISILSLRRNQIKDLSPIAYFKNIVDLRLFDNQISDLTPLAGLENLQSLTLGRNQVVSVAPLKGLAKLDFLSLFDNQITDVTPLAGLTNLNRLELGCNRNLKDVSCLSGLSGLQELFLTGTQVSTSGCPLQSGKCLFLPQPDDPCPGTW